MAVWGCGLTTDNMEHCYHTRTNYTMWSYFQNEILSMVFIAIFLCERSLLRTATNSCHYPECNGRQTNHITQNNQRYVGLISVEHSLHGIYDYCIEMSSIINQNLYITLTHFFLALRSVAAFMRFLLIIFRAAFFRWIQSAHFYFDTAESICKKHVGKWVAVCQRLMKDGKLQKAYPKSGHEKG